MSLKDIIAGEVDTFVEKGADLEHERWAKWQRWLHSQCFKSPEFTGALIIPADLVARWERQIATPYSELSEKEKESDREQVRPYLPLRGATWQRQGHKWVLIETNQGFA